MCPDVKATAAHITQRIEGRNSLCGEQTWRSEGSNEYCSPEMTPLQKLLKELCVAPTYRTAGKADVLWEETAICTIEAAGTGVLTSKERFSEIMTGKSYFQMGWQQPSKARPIGYNRRGREGFRIGA